MPEWLRNLLAVASVVIPVGGPLLYTLHGHGVSLTAIETSLADLKEGVADLRANQNTLQEHFDAQVNAVEQRQDSLESEMAQVEARPPILEEPRRGEPREIAPSAPDPLPAIGRFFSRLPMLRARGRSHQRERIPCSRC